MCYDTIFPSEIFEQHYLAKQKYLTLYVSCQILPVGLPPFRKKTNNTVVTRRMSNHQLETLELFPLCQQFRSWPTWKLNAILANEC